MNRQPSPNKAIILSTILDTVFLKANSDLDNDTKNRLHNTAAIRHVIPWGVGVLHPQSFIRSENLRAVGKFKAFQKKLGQLE